jgi:TolB-like protein
MRVVVLPFENRTGRPENDILGSMAAEWTTRTLDKAGALEMVPSTAVQDLLRGIEDPSSLPTMELAQRTGARYAVVGNFATVGSSLRFEAEVLDVVHGELLSALDPVTGSLDSLEAVVTSASQAFAAGTVSLLLPGRFGMEGVSLPPNMEAYEDWVAGQDAFCQGNNSLAAEAYFRASSLAPAWPGPLLELLVALSNLGRVAERDSIIRILEPLVPTLTRNERYYWIWLTAEDQYERYRAAEVMFSTDPGWAYAMAFRAVRINRLHRARDGVSAIEFDHPCARTWPANWVLAAQVYHLLGEDSAALERVMDGRSRFPGNLNLLIWEGRVRAALGEVARVRELADSVKYLPGTSTQVHNAIMEMGLALRVHDHPDPSVAVLEEAVAWADSHPDVNPFQKARSRYYLGRFDEALPILEELAAADPISQYVGYLALTLDGLGRGAEADSIMEGFSERFPASRYPALLAGRRGDAERAVEFLKGNFRAGMYYYAWNQINLHRDPDLLPIRDHPLFQALMRPTG